MEDTSTGKSNKPDDRRIERRAGRLEEFFWVYDPASERFVYVGAAYSEVSGLAREPLYEVRDAYFEAIHPDDRERVRRAFVDHDGASYDELYRVRRPDGTLRWVRDRAFPLISSEERYPFAAGLATDLTELVCAADPVDQTEQTDKKRKTLRLDRSQKRYKQLFADDPDARLLLDLKGEIIEANRRAGELVGLEARQMVRMKLLSFCHPERHEAVDERLERVAAGNRECFMLSLHSNDGTATSVEATAGLVDFGPEFVIQVTLREQTPRSRMAAELEAAREQIVRAQKMEIVGQLAGGIAHDFNNLLSIISSCAQFIENQLGADSPIIEDTEKIRRASKSAGSLVRRLLTFARQRVDQPEVIAVDQLLADIEPLLEHALPTDVELQLDVDPGADAIRLAAIEFEQIIMNLVINARDAMPDGGELTIEADRIGADEHPDEADRAQDGPSYVRITVRDTGVGIQPETREQIFEPFYSTKGMNKGTGLGLATVLNLVEKNDGSISVESEPGVGTVFEVVFPGAEPTDDKLHKKTTIPTPRAGDETLLVIDNDADVLRLVRRILEGGGYTVLSTQSAPEALDLAHRHGDEIDLLLTDIVMPDIVGPALVEQLADGGVELPVLYTSGFVEDEKTRLQLREQKAHFIAKPLTPDRLLVAVRHALGRASAFSPTTDCG